MYYLTITIFYICYSAVTCIQWLPQSDAINNTHNNISAAMVTEYNLICSVTDGSLVVINIANEMAQIITNMQLTDPLRSLATTVLESKVIIIGGSQSGGLLMWHFCSNRHDNNNNNNNNNNSCGTAAELTNSTSILQQILLQYDSVMCVNEYEDQFENKTPIVSLPITALSCTESLLIAGREDGSINLFNLNISYHSVI